MFNSHWCDFTLYSVSFILVDHFQIVHTFSWGRISFFKLISSLLFIFWSDKWKCKTWVQCIWAALQFFTAVLLSQDLNSNAEYFIGLRHTGKKDVNVKCMTFLVQKLKTEKNETTLALCIKYLPKTIISSITIV